MSTTRMTLVAALLLAGGGCEDESTTPLVYPDSSRPAPDGDTDFNEICKRDEDCASGHCVTMGNMKRCSRACSASAPCPAFKGWTCTAAVCGCVPTGKKPKECNVDGDCDGQPDRIPKKEICDGEDDDCNGVKDDVAPGTSGAKQYYKDGDGDTFGDSTQGTWMCGPKAGWVLKGDDCDDTRKDVNPGQIEICGDAYDNDCDTQKEDFDVCGRIPIVVADVTKNFSSGILKACAATAAVDPSLDITEILAKQDTQALKFTVRLAAAPVLTSCASYTIHFGDLKSSYNLVYIYRPSSTACGSLPPVEAYYKGKKIATSVATAFNAATPGHVSFILQKTELFPNLSTPSYMIKACTNKIADATKDLTVCQADSCATPVHR